MDNRDKILEFVKAKGPVLPSQISKLIGTDMIMASAHLAELTSSNMLKISTIKVGGSPLYYLRGQEAMLQKFTAGMNDKEKKAYDLLQQEKILRDSEQEPVIRVALREIKDFALQLNVNYNSNKEIFWKWHLVSGQEAELLIKSKLNIPDKPVEKKIEDTVRQPQAEKVPKQEIKEQKQAKEKPKEAKSAKIKGVNFVEMVITFFEKNKIKVISAETMKKNSEIDFVVEIPSVVGDIKYYCKAKSKKRINDSDLSSAFVKGQFKKLPVLVVSDGELSSKAKEMLAKELNNITFKKI